MCEGMNDKVECQNNGTNMNDAQKRRPEAFTISVLVTI